MINSTREWRCLATLHTQYYDPVTHRPSPLPLYTLLQLNIADFRDFSSTPPGDCVCNTFCAGKVVSTVYVGDKRERGRVRKIERGLLYIHCTKEVQGERERRVVDLVQGDSGFHDLLVGPNDDTSRGVV